MRRIGLALVLSTVACTRVNPAFDPTLGLADGDTSSGEAATGADEATTADGSDSQTDGGDGDGDTGEVDTGDGDAGDGDTGDGDSGDGDAGDGDSGDGDGDAGDGDSGDGDGDGDGDSGDGDGDGDADCLFEPDGQDHFPFQIASLGFFDTSSAPGFDQAPQQCLMAVICEASAEVCDGEAQYMVKAYSNGDAFVGPGLLEASPLQLRFQPGGGECMGSTLEIDPTQYFKVNYWNGAETQLQIILPCLDEFDVPLYIDAAGSTFWDPQLTEPAALWP